MKKIILGLALLSSISAFGSQPCGLTGSLDQRIKDCDQRKEGFVLITRTHDGREVNQEIKSGLLWSGVLGEYIFEEAKIACMRLKSAADITGRTWRLPTIKEYEAADKSGIRTALPNMKGWFRTASVVRPNNYTVESYFYNGETGEIAHESFWHFAPVRCISSQ
jgi:hypothetical protein